MDTQGKSSFRQRIRQSRAFIFSLIAISAIWLISSMSDQKTYREHYKLSLVGYDNRKYATLLSDSILTLDVTSNGFHAFSRGLKKNHSISLNLSDKMQKAGKNIQLSLEVEDYIDIIRKQIDMRGVTSVKAVNNTINLSLAQRESKAFVPIIDDVIFQFDAMSGLCGNPEIKPDTVFLYGSRTELDQIDAIYAMPQTIKNIRVEGRYRVKLQPVWKDFADVYPSVESILIHIPVDTFIEKNVTVPITFTAAKSIKRVQLYPSEIKVNYLVPKRLYDNFSSDDFQVSVTLDDDSSSYLTPVVTRFPADVRIKNMSPQKIQYIIIK